MKKLTVNAMSATYDILIEKGLLKNSAEYIKNNVKAEKLMIISDSNVAPLYLDTLKSGLLQYGFSVYSHIFTAGEKSKNLTTVSKIYDALSENEFTRKDCVIALGGGVCGDITGFVAATYMRGIDFIQIPTTLLSQVDSSVGGKTGVDTSYGKNLVGAFYQPKIVLIDPDTLDTLSEHYFADGMGEVIKYGCIKSRELFDFLKENDAKESIEEVILICLRIKRDVVSEDEREAGLRMILNFGHTLGHSIEKLSEFSLSHGECVAKGMVMISKATEKLGITKSGTTDEIIKLCEKYSLNTDICYDIDAIAESAKNDKKGSGKMLNLVVTPKIGETLIHKIDKNELAQILG
ncbi:MAG: 3-dehydroquinate synthase [Ruminococcus sp.]|nr:3-dehydroquinate synthase [Ruminococcus sp.]